MVYDSSSTFKLGWIEAMLRDRFVTVLESMTDEASSCLYDPECIDQQGACHGCVHSPEIACRVFNHGLSRAFLLGGHTPWLDVASEGRVTGYWEEF